MIKVTAFNGFQFVINSDHIEKIEEIPETVITLNNGKKYLVKESTEDIIKEVIDFRKKIIKMDFEK